MGSKTNALFIQRFCHGSNHNITLYFFSKRLFDQAVIIGEELVDQMNWLFLNHFISCLIMLSICCNNLLQLFKLYQSLKMQKEKKI